MKTGELTQMLSNQQTLFLVSKRSSALISPPVALHAAKDSFVDNVKS